MRMDTTWVDHCITCSWPQESIYHRRDSEHSSGQKGPGDISLCLSPSIPANEHLNNCWGGVKQTATPPRSLIYQASTSDTNAEFSIGPISWGTNGALGVNYLVPLISWKGQWLIRRVDTYSQYRFIFLALKISVSTIIQQLTECFNEWHWNPNKERSD